MVAIGVFDKQQLASHIGISRNRLNSRNEMPKSFAAFFSENQVGDCDIKFVFSRRAKSEFTVARIGEGGSRQNRTVGVRAAIAD
jgi:hypothetical protein